MHRSLLATSAAVLVLCACAPISVDAGRPAQQAPTISIREYPDSPDGLKILVEDVFEALKTKDDARLSLYFASFAIPDHEAWFARVFGPEEGIRLTARYNELRPQLSADVRRSFENALSSGRTTVVVTRYVRPLEANVMSIERALVEAAKEPLVVFNVSGESMTERYGAFVGRFVFVEGKFRYVRDSVLRALSTAPPLRVRVGGTAQEAKQIYKVDPIYPADARTSRLEGTVALHVVIGTNGAIKELDVVRGDPTLAKAAVDAVKQWRYQPTLLNGDAVESRHID